MPRGNRLLLAAAALLLINAGYLLAARGAHLFHAAQILLHPLLGIATLKLALWSWKRIGPALRRDPLRRWFLITGGVLALSGAGLFVFGSLPATRPLLYLHLGAAAGFAGTPRPPAGCSPLRWCWRRRSRSAASSGACCPRRRRC